MKAVAGDLLSKLSFNDRMNINAGGEIMLDRGVKGHINSTSPEYLVEPPREILANADFTFGNLECSIYNQGASLEDRFAFRTYPSCARALKKAGFDFVNLANNHLMNYGREGLEATIKHLSSQGIQFVGAGKNMEEASKPIVLEKHGIKLGVLGYQNIAPWHYANSRKAGTVPISKQTYKNIRNLKDQVDAVIVSMHWDREYHNKPLDTTKDIAHGCIDSGADIVLGHHPHVLQGIELYNFGMIVYSLGNFIFDQRRDKQTETMILNFDINEEGVVNHNVIPCRLVYKEKRPKILKGNEREQIKRNIENYDRLVSL